MSTTTSVKPADSLALETDFERQVVGGCLLCPERTSELTPILKGTDFIDPELGRLFDFIASEYARDPSKHPSEITAAAHSEGMFADLGGVRAAKELIMGVVDVGAIVYYAERVAAYKSHEPPDPKSPAIPTVEMFDAFLGRLERREGAVLYDLPAPLTGFEIGPGLISIIGAPPGSGKTALASQIVFDALAESPSITATIANAEMSFEVLMGREISRRTGIRYDDIRFARLTDDDLRQIREVAAEIREALARVRWLDRLSYEGLKDLRHDRPGLMILDYLQKFVPGDGEARAGVNAVMATLRNFALDGWGIIGMSATTRTRGKGGSTHDSKELSLASFRESGEIEFNADSCYLLKDQGPVGGKDWLRAVDLECVKNRHGAQSSFQLEFHRPRMQFRPRVPDVVEWSPDGTGEYRNPFGDFDDGEAA